MTNNGRLEGHNGYAILTQQLDLPLPVGERIDVSFLHKSFCLAGLPIRRPKDNFFSRTDDRFALTINSRKLALPGGGLFDTGVPWGAKARLLIVWMSTQAKDPNRVAGDRWLEIGRIREWLASIGIKPNGDAIAATKEQLIRLSFASFDMVWRENGLDLFKGDQLVDGAAFDAGDLAHYATGAMDKVRWPTGILMSTRAYDRFSKDAIPIPTQRLREISHSAMAIDTFVYLCYKLPQVPKGETQLVPWRDLIASFGSKEAPSLFRANFSNSIATALNAYPEAKVDMTDEGLVLHHSDPAELRQAFISVVLPDTGKPRRQLRNRTKRKPTEAT
jgi:hypothetical protein